MLYRPGKDEVDNLIRVKYIPANQGKSNGFYSALNISQGGTAL
jgi:hypothetical protein